MISDNWEKYCLGDLIKSISETYKFQKDKIIFLNTGDILEGKILHGNYSKVTTLPGQAKKKIQKNDILFSEIRPANKRYAVIDFDAQDYVVSTKLMVLRANEKINTKFLLYLLTNKQRLDYLQSVAENRSGTFPQITFNDIKSIEIDLPSIQEQSRIATILSSLDDKIELNLQMNKTLEAIAQAIFKEWFVDFRFPGFDGELVDGLPKGWKKDEFINHIDAERGLSYKGSGLANQGNGIPMNNLNSVYEGGGYKFEGIKYYNGEYKERHITRPGDIIVANTEQGHKYLLIGYPGVVPNFYGEKTIFSHHIFRVRPREGTYLTSQFIYYLFLQPNIRDQIVGCCNGTTVNMLKIDGLQRPLFFLPPIELIKNFSDFAQGVWQRKETNYVENQILTQLRDTLLPKLMTGKIKVA